MDHILYRDGDDEGASSRIAGENDHRESAVGHVLAVCGIYTARTGRRQGRSLAALALRSKCRAKRRFILHVGPRCGAIQAHYENSVVCIDELSQIVSNCLLRRIRIENPYRL